MSSHRENAVVFTTAMRVGTTVPDRSGVFFAKPVCLPEIFSGVIFFSQVGLLLRSVLVLDADETPVQCNDRKSVTLPSMLRYFAMASDPP